mgnify:CR=1 FL=1
MATSTVASDKAKWKKMFISWVESVVILFTLVNISSYFLSGEEWYGMMRLSGGVKHAEKNEAVAS